MCGLVPHADHRRLSGRRRDLTHPDTLATCYWCGHSGAPPRHQRRGQSRGEEGRMSQAKWSGVIWLLAATLGVVATIVFRIDPLQWAVTMVAALAAALVGLLLLRTRRSDTITWSNGLGVVWLLVYAALTLVQRDEVAAWTTDVVIGA